TCNLFLMVNVYFFLANWVESIDRALWPNSIAKSLYPRNRAPQYQRMDIMRALIGIDHFQIHHVPDYAEFVGDAIPAKHIARHACHVERLATGIAFHHRGDLRRCATFIFHAPQTQAALQAER